MPSLTLQDIPDDLHGWLQQQAARHQRSLGKEVVALLEKLRSEPRDTAELTPDERFKAIMEISRRCAALPELDPRSADEIIGYDENGIPC